MVRCSRARRDLSPGQELLSRVNFARVRRGVVGRSDRPRDLDSHHRLWASRHCQSYPQKLSTGTAVSRETRRRGLGRAVDRAVDGGSRIGGVSRETGSKGVLNRSCAQGVDSGGRLWGRVWGGIAGGGGRERRIRVPGGRGASEEGRLPGNRQTSLGVDGGRPGVSPKVSRSHRARVGWLQFGVALIDRSACVLGLGWRLRRGALAGFGRLEL